MPRSGSCPVCGRPAGPRAANRAHPFCSERCQLVDLGQWLGEAYRIHGDRAGDGSAPTPCPAPEGEGT